MCLDCSTSPPNCVCETRPRDGCPVPTQTPVPLVTSSPSTSSATSTTSTTSTTSSMIASQSTNPVTGVSSLTLSSSPTTTTTTSISTSTFSFESDSGSGSGLDSDGSSSSSIESIAESVPAELTQKDTNNDEPSKPSDDSLSIIIGASIGAALLLILIAVAIAYVIHRRKRNQTVDDNRPPEQGETAGTDMSTYQSTASPLARTSEYGSIAPAINGAYDSVPPVTSNYDQVDSPLT
jgi:hypothetical protein